MCLNVCYFILGINTKTRYKISKILNEEMFIRLSWFISQKLLVLFVKDFKNISLHHNNMTDYFLWLIIFYNPFIKQNIFLRFVLFNC